MPSGVEIDDFYVIERSKLLHVIAIKKDGHFIFEKQYRYAINRECLEICAGIVEIGETPSHAAMRELQEETGYANGECFLSEQAVDPSNMTKISFAFFAKDVVKVSEQILDETDELEFVIERRGGQESFS